MRDISDISDFMDFSPTRQIQVAACEKLRDTDHGISALQSSMSEGVRSPNQNNSYMELYQMSTQAMARKKDELFMQSLPKAHFHSQIKAILQKLVSSNPIGSPSLKSRPPLQPSFNTTNIAEQDRGLKTAGAV
ncbi:hypothetical protein TNCV_4280241 [Trichonephila clavipes]|nr:hypothetical protein TNCV_4280241 [Trichonephila clavipes]